MGKCLDARQVSCCRYLPNKQKLRAAPHTCPFGLVLTNVIARRLPTHVNNGLGYTMCSLKKKTAWGTLCALSFSLARHQRLAVPPVVCLALHLGSSFHRISAFFCDKTRAAAECDAQYAATCPFGKGAEAVTAMCTLSRRAGPHRTLHAILWKAVGAAAHNCHLLTQPVVARM
jgi:hypothetical protein